MAKESRRISRKQSAPHPDQGKVVELTLEEPAHGGACIAHDAEGRVIFVRLGAPGETVRVIITSAQSKLAWGEVTEVINPSPNRVSPDWLSGAIATQDGAELAHLTPTAQREWKSAVLRSQIRRIGGIDLVQSISTALGEKVASAIEMDGQVPRLDALHVSAAPGDESDESLLQRRSRARFIVGPNKRLCLRKYRSHSLIPIDDYPFIDGVFAEAGLFDEDSSWQKLWKPGQKVELICPSDSDPVVLVDKKAWKLDRQPGSLKTKWTVTSTVDTRRGETTRFEVQAGGFWQVHRRAPEVITDAVIRGAGGTDWLEGKNVMELYSGSGLLTRFLGAGVGAKGKICSLESSEIAVKAAEKNCRSIEDAHGFQPSTHFFQGMVDAESIGELEKELRGRTDLVVLDPPRQGAGKAIIESVTRTTAEKVVLVSCDPAAAARDLADFVKRGFAVTKIEAWDIFPHTHHFETITTLERS